MNRRTYLGACAGSGVVGLAGCLDAVGSRVARTEAAPAIAQWSDEDCNDGDVCVRPHIVRAIDEEIDSGNPMLGTVQIRGWLGGTQLRAQDYNSSRSNKPSRGQDPDSDGDGVDDGDDETRANNHNTTRSNRDNPVRGEGDGSDEAIDMEQAFDYLDDDDDGDGVVVAETFVLSVPAVDIPGVKGSSINGEDLEEVKNAVSEGLAGAPTNEETVLRELTTPTMLRRCCDASTPILYPGRMQLSTPEDDDSPLAGEWQETSLRGETSATDQSEPVAGRAVATLDGGVKLPVLVWAQRLVHGGDTLFVAGWVVDDARLYTNAATVLTAPGRTDVREYTSQMGQVHPSREGAFMASPDDGFGPDGAVLEAAMAARGSDGGGVDHGWAGLFIVPMDAPLVHDRRIIREVGKKK
jgi:hypothetical protein